VKPLVLLLALVACERADQTTGTVRIGTRSFAVDVCEPGATYGFDGARVLRGEHAGGILVVSPTRGYASPPRERNERVDETVFDPSRCTVYVHEAARVQLECATEPPIAADVRVGACK
jgi:hypothetical protein